MKSRMKYFNHFITVVKIRVLAIRDNSMPTQKTQTTQLPFVHLQDIKDTHNKAELPSTLTHLTTEEYFITQLINFHPHSPHNWIYIQSTC
jgi:hypothetical protein